MLYSFITVSMNDETAAVFHPEVAVPWGLLMCSWLYLVATLPVRQTLTS